MTRCSDHAVSALPAATPLIGPLTVAAEGERALVFQHGKSYLVFNINGELHALDNECPHGGAALSSGPLDGHAWSCPAHGLRLDVRTGCMHGVPEPAGMTIATRAVHLDQDGQAFLCRDPSASV